ncbi:MAG: DUF4157 domain-containing protein [Acidobacteria bacterium]|nr:DUF4157 domain-containing protein [Acidobacteriota bacterium]
MIRMPLQRAPAQAPASPATPRFATQRSWVPPSVERGIEEARGGGQPLPEKVQASLAPTFGPSLTQVRVHADPRADRLAGSVQARAFTVGRDVFFRSGEYSPGSTEGVELLAHELTHVVQQGTGQVPAASVAQPCSACGKSDHSERRPEEPASSPSGLALGPADDRFEKEAHQVAQAVGSGKPAPILQRRRETVLQRFCEDDPAVNDQPAVGQPAVGQKRRGSWGAGDGAHRDKVVKLHHEEDAEMAEG